MNTTIRFYIYITIVLLATGAAWRHFRRLRRPFKIIAILLFCTAVHEVTAAWMGRKYGNNMPAYHLYTIVNIVLVSLYYNESLPIFKKYHIGWYIAALGVLATVLNSWYLQPWHILNSHAILFSSDCIVAMALYSLYRIYVYNDLRYIGRNPYFWISLIFLFFWCTTFLTIASLQPFLMMKWMKALKVSRWVLWIANILYYTAIGMVFIRLTPQKLSYVD